MLSLLRSCPALVVLIAAAWPLSAQAAPFESTERFGSWFMYYYLDPEPSRVPEALVYYSDSELHEMHSPGFRFVFAHFFAAAIREHPGIQQQLVDSLAAGSQAAKLMGARVLYLVDTDGARQLLVRAKDLWQNDTVSSEIERLVAERPPDLLNTTPVVADMLWAKFSATGDAEPVEKIAQQASRYTRWSLVSNIRQHERVREIVEHLIETSGEDHKSYLEEVLKEALGGRRPSRPTPSRVAAAGSELWNMVYAQRVPVAPIPAGHPAAPATHLNRDWPDATELDVLLYPDFAAVNMERRPVQDGPLWDMWETITFVSQHSADTVLGWYAEHLNDWKVDVSEGVVIPEDASFSDVESWRAPHVRVEEVAGGECGSIGFPCQSQATIIFQRSSTPVTTQSLEAYRQYSVARDLQWEGNRQQSAERVREALTLDPEFAMAWRMLAANLLALRDSAEAEEALQHALRLRDQVSETERLHIDGSKANRTGNAEAALTAYERIVDLNPRDAMAHFNRAVWLRRLGRDAESVEAYDRVIELDPRHRSAHSNRANVLLKLGRYLESFESFKKGAFGRTLERYLFFAPSKAVALARDSSGPWAFGYSSRQSSVSHAVERAIDECATRADRFRGQLECRLYAVGNDIVWGDDPFGKDAPSGPVAAMKSDLLILAIAQAFYFNDHVAYTDDVRKLSPVFEASPGVQITMSSTEMAWRATARHDDTSVACHIFIGPIAPPFEGMNEGEPFCKEP